MSLGSAEHLIYSTRLSKQMFARTFAVSALALVIPFLFRAIAAEYSHYVFWIFTVVAVALWVSTLTKYFSSHYVVTNQRVLIHHGFLARTSYEMVLKKIESVTVNQTLSDRFIWGSGTLVITGTGGTKEIFPNVGGAVAFQEHLNEALNAV